MLYQAYYGVCLRATRVDTNQCNIYLHVYLPCRGFTSCGVYVNNQQGTCKQSICYAGGRATSKPNCGCPSRRNVLSCAWPRNTKATPTNEPDCASTQVRKHLACWQLTAAYLLHHELPRDACTATLICELPHKGTNTRIR